MPVPEISRPLKRPVVKPSWSSEFTPNLLPNCVVGEVPELLNVRRKLFAPAIGTELYAICPPTGVAKDPSALNVRLPLTAGVTSEPLTKRRVSQLLAALLR